MAVQTANCRQRPRFRHQVRRRPWLHVLIGMGKLRYWQRGHLPSGWMADRSLCRVAGLQTAYCTRCTPGDRRPFWGDADFEDQRSMCWVARSTGHGGRVQRSLSLVADALDKLQVIARHTDHYSKLILRTSMLGNRWPSLSDTIIPKALAPLRLESITISNICSAPEESCSSWISSNSKRQLPTTYPRTIVLKAVAVAISLIHAR